MKGSRLAVMAAMSVGMGMTMAAPARPNRGGVEPEGKQPLSDEVVAHELMLLEQAQQAQQRRVRQYRRGVPLANLSRNHPDYGMTPAEHEAAKAQRERDRG